MIHRVVTAVDVSQLHDKERAYEERVLTRYRLYSGLFLGLPFEHLRRTAELLPVFAEHCRRLLRDGVAPQKIVDRFFAETPTLADLERRDVEFLFSQLVERQIVLFDALEDAGFAQTHDLEAPGSVAHLADAVARDDLRADLGQLLQRTSTRIVLTAHPTQFYPRTVQGIIADLRRALIDREPAEVERLLLQLGKTRFTNRARPTPVEEAERVLDVVADVFYRVLPGTVSHALMAAWGRDDFVNHLPAIPNLQIGFWPGGDRDGNPYVTADVTEAVARALKARLLSCYLNSVTALARRLTFEGAHEAVLAILDRLEATQRMVALEAVPHEGNSVDPHAYVEAAQFAGDVRELRAVVLDKHQGLFVGLVDELLIRIHLFGFYFAVLDVRQNSSVFSDTLKELAAADALRSLDPPLPGEGRTWDLAALGRVAADAAAAKDEVLAALSPLARDTLLTLRLIPKVQRSNGVDGLNRVVISHTRGPSDVLAVLALAKVAGLEVSSLALDVVPLFESVEDLGNAEATLTQLFENGLYRQHLARRGNRQTVMVGFSDGTKDGGYVTANLAIREAKRAMTRIGRASGIELVFFDGRGGPPARGGGNTHRFYRTRDLGVDQWQQQLTIQGQTISSNFGSAKLAQYHVEQLFTANIENLLWPSTNEDPPRAHRALLNEISERAHKTYCELRDDPVLIDFLAEHSPLPLFDHLTIASRPVSRKKSDRLELEQLRAIPFVATWSILKMQVPGYYGLGTALDTLVREGREAEVRSLYRDSGFFRTLLDNAAMSLLKSRFDVHGYLEDDPRFGALFRRIRDEAERSKLAILRVSQQPRLLANDSINRMSIEMRERIVLPLLVLVQAAYLSYLELKRDEDEDSEQALALRKLSLKGIAAIINATRNAA